jgi:integrase
MGAKVLTIPAERMKAGVEFKLPLCDVVHNMLVARGALGRAEYVFPGRSKGYTQSFASALQAIRKANGIVVSPHDLRRTFASVAEAVEGLSVYALKRMLAHANTNVTMDYVQSQEKVMAKMVQKVADQMKEHCDFEALPENVASLPAARYNNCR